MNNATDTRSGRRRFTLWLGSVVAALALLVGAAIPAAAAELMRVTFVRHGQSLGNASGTIDSSTPGPVLSDLGHQQAESLIGRLGDNNYDAIYASTMVRTQLTAAPMSRYLGLPIQVLPGLQEIEAGDYEGTPERDAASGYMLAPLAWSMQGDLDARIPGSLNGHEFKARMDGALQTMYDNGDRNAVVFSHGAAIMFWTFMSVDNLTVPQKLALLGGSMPNTGYVVIEGNAEDGWKLVNWNGQEFSQQRTFGAELKLQIRTLVRQLKVVVDSVGQALGTRDPVTIANALNHAVSEAAFSVVKFNRAVTAEAIERLEKVFTRSAPAQRAEITEVNRQSVKELSESAETSSPAKELVGAAVADKGGSTIDTVKSRLALNREALKVDREALRAERETKRAERAEAVKSRLGIDSKRGTAGSAVEADSGSDTGSDAGSASGSSSDSGSAGDSGGSED